MDEMEMLSKQKSAPQQDKTTSQTASPSTKHGKDMWDKLAAIGPVISGICVFAIGGYFTYVQHQEQLRIQEIETMEKFLPRLSGDEQSKRAAILAISSLTNAELAKRITAIYSSNGTPSAMHSINQSGMEKNRSAASPAQTQSLENSALSKSKLKDMERDLKAVVDRQENSPDSQARDLSYNLTKLADLYALDGQYDLAEPLLKSSLTLREKMYGPANAQVVDILKSLSEISSLRGQQDESVAYLHRAREIEAKLAREVSTAKPVGKGEAIPNDNRCQAQAALNTEAAGAAQAVPSDYQEKNPSKEIGNRLLAPEPGAIKQSEAYSTPPLHEKQL